MSERRSTRSSRTSEPPPMTWEEEEEEERLQQRSRASRAKRASERDSARAEVGYCEADSEDEFAQQYLMLSSEEEEQRPKRVKTVAKSKSESQSGSSSKRKKAETAESDSDDNDNNDADNDNDDGGDEIEYRIQHILGRKAMSPAEWRAMNESYTTIEVTKGSVWQQPDEEYFDPSPEPLEKFLIKWAHASYLHTSWETEKDLLDNVGPTAKNQIKKFRLRELEGRELFEDLSKGELFPPSFCQIERILDADDPEVDMFTVDWRSAELPTKNTNTNTNTSKAVTDKETPQDAHSTENNENVQGSVEIEAVCCGNKEEEQEKDNENKDNAKADDDEEEVLFSTTRRSSRRSSSIKRISYLENEEDEEQQEEGENRSKDKEDKSTAPSASKLVSHKHRSKKQRLSQFLHGDNCWLTVKWEGLPYSEVSFESLNDLIARGVDFEAQLRAFYRREQRALMLRDKRTTNKKLQLDETIVGSKASPPTFSGGVLRDYQWEGVRWMLFNISQGRNCILADEMGLGKTIQSSALMFMLKKLQPSSGPFLVVAPLSTIVNWQREVTAWTDLDCILYYGSQEDRELIRSYEFRFLTSSAMSSKCSNNSSSSGGYKIEVVITTPETCMAFDEKSSAGSSSNKLKRELSRIHWDLVIVDEAHKLKNFDSKFSSTLRDEYSFRHCVLLTGTPLQNSTEELWTLLNFVANEDFADRDDFIRKFGDLKSSTQLDALHKRIKPYLLRREKEIVEKGVPPKKEVVIEVELTVPQKQYYRAIYEQKTGFLYKSGTKDGPSLSNLAMELRKCCNHPFLIKGAANELSKHFVNDSLNDILIKSSGKMTLLDKLLPKLQRDGHRVLIFSQFRMMLDLIEDYLHNCGYAYERVDGSVVGKKRQAAIDRYSQNDHIFAMLLSTRAGGVGINLTAADTVIIFDSDWNPQNDIQAQARAHRIGQTRAVTVYRLLTKKTYEMVMFRTASIKLGLDYAVMHNLGHSAPGDSSALSRSSRSTRSGRAAAAQLQQLEGVSSERAEHASSLSKKELETLLKHGAYDMFLEDKEGNAEIESSRFVEESIEQILERSSVFVHQDKENDNGEENNSQGDNNDPSGGTTKAISFAKASFVSAAESGAEGNEVAIDDPDFWSKVIGIAVEEESSGVGAKRKCRQVVESYREPTDSIRSIYGSLQNALRDEDDSDGDNEENEENPGEEKKQKRRRKDEIVPAEYSAENVLSLLQALLYFGYGPWEKIKRASKLRWALADIRRGAQLAVLFAALASSLSVSLPGDEQQHQKEKTSNPTADQNNNDTDAVDANNDDVNGSAVDEKTFFSTVRKYKLSKLVLRCFLEEKSLEEEQALLKAFSEKLLDAPQKTDIEAEQGKTDCISLTLSQYKQLFDAQFTPKELQDNDNSETNHDESVRVLVQRLRGMSEIQSLFRSAAESEDSAEKLQKRTLGFRTKLQQIEDLFEGKIFCELCDTLDTDTKAERANDEQEEDPNQGEGEVGDNGKDTEKIADDDAKNDSVTVAVNRPVPNTFLPAVLGSLLVDESTTGKKTPSWWNTSCDVALLQAVRQSGWPEGKKRVAAVLDTLSQLPSADASCTQPMSELVTQKFALQRFKSLCKTLRHAEEDVAAAEKQRASSKASARQQTKKNTVQLLKLVQRSGYPRSAYIAVRENILETVLDEKEREERLAALCSWEELAKECGFEDGTQAQTIVHNALEVLNNSDAPDNEVVNNGVIEDIPMKLIKTAFEKSEVIHHIRLTLACHSSAAIKEFIEENCKGTGPSVPSFRRDMTMPVWWTLEHDVALLRLCLSQGYGAWKAICADALMNAVPEDFVMPPKANGVEWTMQLTTRNADKRVRALLRGMPPVKNLPLPPPSSPQRKGASVQQKVVSTPVPSKNFWFQQQKTPKETNDPKEAVKPPPCTPKEEKKPEAIEETLEKEIKSVVEPQKIDQSELSAPSTEVSSALPPLTGSVDLVDVVDLTAEEKVIERTTSITKDVKAHSTTTESSSATDTSPPTVIEIRDKPLSGVEDKLSSKEESKVGENNHSPEFVPQTKSSSISEEKKPGPASNTVSSEKKGGKKTAEKNKTANASAAAGTKSILSFFQKK